MDGLSVSLQIVLRGEALYSRAARLSAEEGFGVLEVVFSATVSGWLRLGTKRRTLTVHRRDS